jgi:hypothetical protein
MRITVSLSGKDVVMKIGSGYKPMYNSQGRLIHSTEQGIINFWKWFGKSVAVDEQGRPLVLYHGSKETFHAIDPKRFGSGIDQYGSGFYMTTDSSVASGYADGEGGNITAMYARLVKPIGNRKLTALQIRTLIVKSPELDDMLWNFGDYVHEGKGKVLNQAVNAYTQYQTSPLDTLNGISNDFYSGNEGEFLANAHAVTKYDGVVVPFDTNTHYVVWLPNQIKSVHNNGQFSKADSIIATNAEVQ